MKKLLMPLPIFLALCFAWPNQILAERKGKEITVRTLDAREITGELIAVKADSLLLLEKSSGRDVTIKAQDIMTIRIIRKTKALQGALLGLISGAVIGAASGYAFQGDAEPTSVYIKVGAVVFAGIGLPVGLITSGILGYDSIHPIKGDIRYFGQAVREKLRKHARIRDAF